MLASRMSVRTSRECVADYRTEIGLVEAAGDRNDAAARIYWILLWSCRRGTLKNCRSRYFTSARIGNYIGRHTHGDMSVHGTGPKTFPEGAAWNNPLGGLKCFSRTMPYFVPNSKYYHTDFSLLPFRISIGVYEGLIYKLSADSFICDD
ncbi:uncharacterized protein LOC143896303 isoform X1 [Temnothorax americanus]|uniref:uncharacterized protein LOC143896303 isoform X1 n=1 Tax=Temnothorax americanus TaxID=1964332 RepID=UPI004067D20C